MGERITTERARELLAKSTPGPWRAFNDADEDEDDDPEWTIAKSRSGCTTSGVVAGGVLDMSGEDAALIAAAPDLAADLIDARAQIAALTAAQGVTVEAHARAVRGAYFEGRSDAPEDYWTATKSKRDPANGWLSSNALGDVLAALRAAGVPDAQAVAMVDGEVAP